MQRRRRHRAIGIGIGIGALALVGALLLLATGFLPGAAEASAVGVGPFLTVGGNPIPYQGPQAFTLASIDSRTSRDLAVFVIGDDVHGGDPCGPPALGVRVDETRTTVRVFVADYEAVAPPATGCAAVGYLPSAHAVRLAAPLGGRQVVDASTGKAARLLDGSDHPSLPRVPSGSGSASLTEREPGGPVDRTWYPARGGTQVVQISDQTPASLRTIGPYGRVAKQTEVRGTPATVYQGVGSWPGTWFVQWTPNARQTITLSVATGAGHRWDAASALALARTVTGYTTSPTGRLGEPDSRGTVAATYSSADGPLADAVNLFKSSGVYVSVDCVGAGRLTVIIRDRRTSFTCTGSLTHHAFESVGAPYDAFRTSVIAGQGVRWALSLARASLDGS